MITLVSNRLNMYWLDLTKVNASSYQTFLPLNFLVAHLDSTEKWHVNHTKKDYFHKYKSIYGIILGGLGPLAFDPISVEYNLKKKKFRVFNGLTRITVFRDYQIPDIRADIYLTDGVRE